MGDITFLAALYGYVVPPRARCQKFGACAPTPASILALAPGNGIWIGSRVTYTHLVPSLVHADAITLMSLILSKI